MLSQSMRNDIIAKIREERQNSHLTSSQNSTQNQALIDRILTKRNQMNDQLKQDIKQDREKRTFERRQDFEQNEQREFTLTNSNSPDSLKKSSDLNQIQNQLQEQLRMNQELQQKFDSSLQRIRENSEEADKECQYYVGDPYQQLENRIRNFSEQRRKVNQNYYQCHSDGEDIQQEYYQEETDKNQNKEVYVKQVVKKYSGQVTSQRICQKKSPKNQQQDYSFKPEIHEMPKQIYGERMNSQIEMSKQEIWERLLQSKRDQIDYREQLKREKDIEDVKISGNQIQQFEKKCTFRPLIQRSLADTPLEEPVEERLFREGQEVKRRREILQKMKLEREQQEYTFNPDIEESKSKLRGDILNQKPLYERIDEVLKKKQLELFQKKYEIEISEQNSFKPKISEKSNQLAVQKITCKDVVERLTLDAQEKAQRRNAEQEEHSQPLAEECTFVPNINPTIEVNRVAQQEFTQKQYLFADLLKEKKEKLVQDFMKQQNFTFKPEVNKQSALIVEVNPERMEETSEKKFVRLSQKDHEKKIILQEQLQEAYYKQFSFRPSINQISSQIGKQTFLSFNYKRKRSLNDLAYNKEAEEKKKLKKEEIEKQERHECSFQPKIQKKDQYNHIQSKYQRQKIKENLLLEEQIKKQKIEELQKQQKLDLLLRQLEYNELKECTFKPQTIKDPVIPKEQLIDKVRGLQTFIQNKENHKRQIVFFRKLQKNKEDQKTREQEIFEYQRKYDPNKHLTETKPVPFRLSQNNPGLQKQLYEEAIQKEKEICTFHPKINRKTNSHYPTEQIYIQYDNGY